MLHNSNQSALPDQGQANPASLLDAKDAGFLVRCQWPPCGKSLYQKVHDQKRGPAPKYCSRACQSKAYRQRKRQALAADQEAQS